MAHVDPDLLRGAVQWSIGNLGTVYLLSAPFTVPGILPAPNPRPAMQNFYAHGRKGFRQRI